MKRFDSTEIWNSTLTQVRSAVRGDPFWEEYLNTADSMASLNIHVAIMVEPYLRYVLDGKKTVESRFSVNRIAPYDRVRKGDILLLKKSGGPIMGICQASEIWYYELAPDSWKEIRREFTQMLCAQDPNFWSSRKQASYATLIRLANVRGISPVKFSKLDRRGWVILDRQAPQVKVVACPDSTIIGFAGALGSGKSTLSNTLADTLNCRRISFGDYVRKEARKRGLGESREVLQEIGAQLVADTDRFCSAVLTEGGWRRGESLVLDGIRHLSVLDSLKKILMPFHVHFVFISTRATLRAKRIRRRGTDNLNLLQQFESHSTEKEVQEVLPDLADLILDGEKTLKANLRTLLSWLGKETARGKHKINELREEFRPQVIKFLLIAESPPDCQADELRFFYNPDVEKYDFMFRNVMRVLFSDFQTNYRPGMKRHYLERFCRAGFFFIDATDVPINRLKGKERLQAIRKELKGKLLEVRSLISKEIPVFLITNNVFKTFYWQLKEMGYKVAHEKPIPFPGQGHQIRFREDFRRLLSKAGYSIVDSNSF